MKVKDYYGEKEYIHYSNCHEDADFALKYVPDAPGAILCIASALDNALAFLLKSPERIVAIDSNETQIYLCRLKICAIGLLTREEFLSFYGFTDGDSLALYRKIRPSLDSDTAEYFDSRPYLISDVKLANCGRFEYYFNCFRKKVLPLTNTKKTVRAFMNAADIEEQRTVFYDKFFNLRLRLLFNLFFSKAVMKKLGRDADYFKYENGSLSSLQKKNFVICAENNLNRENPYLQYVISGRMETPPAYLAPGNYETVKKNVSKITVKKAEFRDEISRGDKYGFIYLSDVFEYMSEEETDRLAPYVYESLTEGGSALLYNMMADRRIGAGLQETKLDMKYNRTFYYKNCYIYKKV